MFHASVVLFAAVHLGVQLHSRLVPRWWALLILVHDVGLLWASPPWPVAAAVVALGVLSPVMAAAIASEARRAADAVAAVPEELPSADRLEAEADDVVQLARQHRHRAVLRIVGER